MTQDLAARLKRAGRRCTVQVAMNKQGVWLRRGHCCPSVIMHPGRPTGQAPPGSTLRIR